MVKIFSIVIPVFKNAESVSELVEVLSNLARLAKSNFDFSTEVIFVVDGSPDNCYELLEKTLPDACFSSQLIHHSRNFGSFAAIRTGLQAAYGNLFCVVAADLQEPPELALLFLEKLLSDECDVVVGCRMNRQDPYLSRIASNLFWKIYKRFVIREIPEKGVDVFGCNKIFRDQLLKLEESHSSLIGLIFWLGYRRSEVLYERRLRQHGKSAWTFKQRIKYMLDSIFSFTDLPIKMLTLLGILSMLISIFFGIFVIFAKIFDVIPVPGYATTLLTVIFFGGLNSLGLGIVGTYAWRAYENTKGRPLAVVMALKQFNLTNLTQLDKKYD
jgi:glycosyltransferase involved in cell wall biosynthesis